MTWIDKLFVGEVVQDFGVVQTKRYGIARTTTSVLVVERKGKLKLVIKQSSVAILAAGVSYVEIDAENVPGFREAVDQAVTRVVAETIGAG